MSPKVCELKDVLTEVDLPGGQSSAVQTSDVIPEPSCIPHVSSAENVGYFKKKHEEGVSNQEF